MKILSLGLGVQSTALYYMSSTGELPRVDFAIFADTGKEKKKTLEYLDYLQDWAKRNNGVPIITVRKRNLFKDILIAENSSGQRFTAIPAYTIQTDGTEGMMRRQCTREYKIAQIDLQIREIFGLRPRQRTPQVEVWKGITLDEIERMSIPMEKWKTHIYPFVGYVVKHAKLGGATKWDFDKKMTRGDVVLWYQRRGLPVPPKSSCVFCPFQSDLAWSEMKRNDPEDWAAAVEIDNAIRHAAPKGEGGLMYLHDSMKPLEEIVFDEAAPDLWKGECSGVCHT